MVSLLLLRFLRPYCWTVTVSESVGTRPSAHIDVAVSAPVDIPTITTVMVATLPPAFLAGGPVDVQTNFEPSGHL